MSGHRRQGGRARRTRRPCRRFKRRLRLHPMRCAR